jgi:hypothetical protein
LLVGVALAFRDTDKVCVSIQNDGDLLYTAGSLWTAAHHQIPMLVVMFNNQSYYQDVGHQTTITQMRERPLEIVGIGVDLLGPATDFATLAKSFSLCAGGPSPCIGGGKERKEAGLGRHHDSAKVTCTSSVFGQSAYPRWTHDHIGGIDGVDESGPNLSIQGGPEVNILKL